MLCLCIPHDKPTHVSVHHPDLILTTLDLSSSSSGVCICMTWQCQQGVKRGPCLSKTKTHPAAPGDLPPLAETARKRSGKIFFRFFCPCEEVGWQVLYYPNYSIKRSSHKARGHHFIKWGMPGLTLVISVEFCGEKSHRYDDSTH